MRLGALAGVLGLGCCVYPIALVLFGFASAAAAVDLGNRLYADWGWAFKGAAIVFAAAAFWVQRRRATRCGIASPRIRSFLLPLVVTGIGVYASLYALTTWLGSIAR